MRVLITGASGFIGGYAVREAVARGHRVLALSRSRPAAVPGETSSIEWLLHDLGSSESPKLAGLGIDAVIHLAAGLSGNAGEQHRATVLGTVRLLDAMRHAGIKKLVGISSIAVLDYPRMPALSLIDETTATPAHASGMGTYSRMKLEQENLSIAFGGEPGNRCVVLRPGLVYDDERLIGAHAGIVKGPLCLLAVHEGQVPVVEARGLARAILEACERDVASGEIIHLVDDNLPGLEQYIAGLRRRGGLSACGVRVPWRMLSMLALSLRVIFRLLGQEARLPEVFLRHGFAARLKPFRFSNHKAKRLLVWVPAGSFS